MFLSTGHRWRRFGVSLIVAFAPITQADDGLGADTIASDVSSLSDARFSPRNVRQGLWSPDSFQRRRLGGVYFTQSYQPGRTAVLFIHGISGSPRDFQALIAGLDQRLFQPCVFFYASGASLHRVTMELADDIRDIHARHEVSELLIVAHSMGGLIARDLLVNLDMGAIKVPILVTISTPWGGHAGAAFGARFTPVSIESWFDVASGSAYLESLFDSAAHLPKNLPETTQHHLIFTFGGGQRRSAGDEVVTLASQLSQPAQEQAKRIYGMSAAHSEILSLPATSELLNRILISRPSTPPS